MKKLCSLNCINCNPFRHGTLLAVMLTWLALSTTARAQCRNGCGSNGNTFLGVFALGANTTGGENTAVGDTALNFNTTGGFNTAVGFDALQTNKTGSGNTGVGFGALFKNTASDNTAFGSSALEFNTTGQFNTASGFKALVNNTTGSDNTASGFAALASNTAGHLNIALGEVAGFNITTGSNNIDVGNPGALAAESNIIRIGTVVAFTDKASVMHPAHTHTFIAGIHGVAVTGSAVTVNSNGQLGVAPSSARFKEGVKPMDKASEAILALKPVTFRYKKELDPDSIPQFGLVAEQVEKVNPDLVERDADGRVYTVRYEAVNAMLLNEFLKEHRQVQELKSIVARQEAAIAQQQTDFKLTAAQQQMEIKALTAGLKEQASRIRKVSAQLEIGKLASQVAANN